MSALPPVAHAPAPISRDLTLTDPKNTGTPFNVYTDFDLYPWVDLGPDFDLDRELSIESMSNHDLKDIPELLPPIVDLSPGFISAIIPLYEKSSRSLLETLTLDQARILLGVQLIYPPQENQAIQYVLYPSREKGNGPQLYPNDSRCKSPAVGYCCSGCL